MFYIVSQLNSQSEQIIQFSVNQADLMISNAGSQSQNIVGKAKLSGINIFLF